MTPASVRWISLTDQEGLALSARPSTIARLSHSDLARSAGSARRAALRAMRRAIIQKLRVCGFARLVGHWMPRVLRCVSQISQAPRYMPNACISSRGS